MLLEPNESSTQDSEKVERDALFHLITEEIKDMSEADKLQGWTPWVMSATLISMAWLIVQDIWNDPPPVAPIHAVFLVVSLTLLVILSVKGTFNAMTPGHLGRGSFHLLHSNTTALNAFITTLWIGTITVTCLTLPISDVGYILLITGAFLAIVTILLLLGVFAIVFRLSFPIATENQLGAVVFGCIINIFYIATIIIVLKSGIMAPARVTDIRAGGLLALGAYVLVLLSRGGAGRSAMKKTLTELRRDIMMGSLPLDEARQRTRVTLEGLWLSDVVQDDMRALFKLISDVRAIYEDAFRKIETLKASVPISSPSISNLSDFEKVAVSNTLDVLETYGERAQGIATQYFARLRNVQKRLVFTSRFVKGASADKAKLMAELKLAQEPADAALERFVHDFHEIQDAWNLWYPTEPRHHEPFGISARNIDRR